VSQEITDVKMTAVWTRWR